MGKRRPGRTLAVALTESLPRWLDFSLWLGFIIACLVPLYYFVVALRSNTVGKNNGLLESLSGLLGIFLLVRLVRVTVLQILAGRTVVELSREPALVGEPLEYLIRSTRPTEATLFCRQPRGRRNVVTLVQVPLQCGEVRSLTFPDVPSDPQQRSLQPTQWQIEVRVLFARGYVLEEDFPLRVETPSKETPG